MTEATMKSTSPSEEAEERAAGAVLFREEGGRRLYLLLRHQQGGHWGFAKGRMEKGESVLEAAMREIREETGIDDVQPMPGLSFVSRYPIRREGRSLMKTVTYFAVQAPRGAIRLSDEHTDGRWVSVEDALRILTHAESRRILLSVEERLPRGSATEGVEA
jgi:bis(5'-nucleosidyl)-tetraphosphatase